MLGHRAAITLIIFVLPILSETRTAPADAHPGDHIHTQYLAVESGQLRLISEHRRTDRAREGHTRPFLSPEIEQTEPVEADHQSRVCVGGLSLLPCRDPGSGGAADAGGPPAIAAAGTHSSAQSRQLQDRIRPSPLLSRIRVLLV
ncbi:MAG: hypothetical protein ABI682_10135 [Acidobacteriota bacterium]